MNWPAGNKSQHKNHRLRHLKTRSSKWKASCFAVLIQLTSINQEMEFSYIKSIVHISETNYKFMDFNKPE